jgi:hypothetical protein
MSCTAGTLSQSIIGFEWGFVLIRFSENPSRELPRFFGAISTGKTTTARPVLATGPHLGCVKRNDGRGDPGRLSELMGPF